MFNMKNSHEYHPKHHDLVINCGSGGSSVDINQIALKTLAYGHD